MSADASSRADPALKEFQELLAKAFSGDQAACRQLFDRYQSHVVGVVRGRLHRRLRSIVDSGDLAQEVWTDVFADAAAGKDFACPAQFLAFLAAVAGHKAVDLYRRRMVAQKHSLHREEPMADHGDALLGRAGPARDPAEQAAAADDKAHRLAGLSERDRALLDGLQSGEVLGEMARRLQISVKTVRRTAERFQVGQAG